MSRRRVAAHTPALLRKQSCVYRLQVAKQCCRLRLLLSFYRAADRGCVLSVSAALNHADLVIGHNIKFDINWIRECGFVYDGALYDTMVAEYILAKAQSWPLNLAALAGKYGGTQKEKDLVADYLKDGYTFYDIPWEIVREYGIADVMATEEWLSNS